MSAEIREVQERRGGHTLLVGAGESPRIVLFYERCGFVYLPIPFCVPGD